jgi:hypothetical protein
MPNGKTVRIRRGSGEPKDCGVDTDGLLTEEESVG